jgi:hypothetical protein
VTFALALSALDPANDASTVAVLTRDWNFLVYLFGRGGSHSRTTPLRAIRSGNRPKGGLAPRSAHSLARRLNVSAISKRAPQRSGATCRLPRRIAQRRRVGRFMEDGKFGVCLGRLPRERRTQGKSQLTRPTPPRRLQKQCIVAACLLTAERDSRSPRRHTCRYKL